ncbi:peptidoglycan DD-metalloendopeptidase family protein [Paraburkholderia sp.]|uniref:peptidoglycan DD-metalloendopeptidase family protein n=1 Tax=Paraburkholderia sp. TaxID=1926495 RepID=UPI00238274B2|nr:peptidoglycan DD-metalloendopeptidase family protein [Paraburkholderia sp.]MDE1179718.1 peptidoglycan DD-metalloendopeptidase family protein [Paraburkholderia sp.]
MRLKQRHGAITPGIAVGVAMLLGACAGPSWDSGDSTYRSAAPATSTSGSRQVPAGYYRANPGDTLASIATAFAQRPQDIALWNGLAPGTPIVAGQVLRVAPLASGVASGSGAVQSGVLMWPLRGAVLKPFVPGKTKGIVIAGKPGDLVKAAAAGRVVYAGTGIEAYGPLIIIKHDDSLITAYGQNGTVLVREGDAVTQGQAIGEVGNDGQGGGSIQFEVRKDGHPVDPLPWLPR